MIHEIKCWPEYFQPLYIGRKEFEVRKNDRNYKVGDSLLIREFNPLTGMYTKREIVRRITYIIQGVCGLPTDICVMQLR
jgi:hypothetical protein